MASYYNENDPSAAQWLRNLISLGLIPPGDVDTRSIADVQPEDLAGYTQVHLFAGIGGWSYALRLAGWPADRPIWTGSCPCQPFSVAGRGAGTSDERHLWPHMFRLVRACRPAVVLGEQVAGAAGYGWFDGVSADLETEDYACRAIDIPACTINAPHIRGRLYWCAVGNSVREPGGVVGGSVLGAEAPQRGARQQNGRGADGLGVADGSVADAASKRGERGGQRDAGLGRGQLPFGGHGGDGGASGTPTPSLPATTAKRGVPNPQFPCWLMGFPAEWLLGVASATRLSPRWRRK